MPNVPQFTAKLLKRCQSLFPSKVTDVTTGTGTTTFGVSTIPIFIHANSAWRPYVGGCNEYWLWFRSPLGKKRWVLSSSGPCYQDCWHTGLLSARWIASNPRRLKGYELPRKGLHGNHLHYSEITQ